MKNDRKEIFKVRFQKHYPRLCNIAYGYVSDRDDSEDIVQDIFIQIWNKGKDTLPEQEFVAYITTSVKNSCISFLRKKQHHTISLEENPSVANSMPEEIPIEGPENKSPEEHLQAALATLPPKCKDIFLMAKLRQMKYRDIANELNLSEKTIENQMTKAIRLFRTYVAENSVFLILVIAIVLTLIENPK